MNKYLIAISLSCLLYTCHSSLPILANEVSSDYNNSITFSKSLIREFEGLKLQRYKGLGHKEYVIGYGDKQCVAKYKGRKAITLNQAEGCLAAKVNEIYIRLSHDLPNIKPHQYAALISLIYNVGYGAFERSNLHEWLLSKHQDKTQIKGEWLDFNHLNGNVLDGLTTRRIQEYKIFIGNV